jgi:hypothetical protein
MKTSLRRLVPGPVRRAVRRLGGKPLQHNKVPVHKKFRLDLPYDERFPARHDTEHFEIGEGLSLAVYWKDVDLGSGPAFSLHSGASEPLKFDCFGLGRGHYHTEVVSLGVPRETRIWLPEPTRRGQVDRALFEIERNAVYFLSRSVRLKGQDIRPDPEKLARACNEARSVAYRFLDTIPQMQESPAKE